MGKQSTSLYLLSQVKVKQAQKGKDNRRHFSGVASSGKPFEHYGRATIVDLDNLTSANVLPVLYQHSRDQRVGFGELEVVDNQLLINGSLLNSDLACQIAHDADDGFPFQLSAHVEPSSVEELQSGTAEVNGQTVTAPITILRDPKIVEVSFTPTGVDDNTSASVFADDGKGTEIDSDTEIDSEELTMNKEQIKAMQTENAELKAKVKELEEANSKAQRKANIDAQLSKAGFSKDDKGNYQGISDATVSVLLSIDDESAKAMIAEFATALQLSKGDEQAKTKPPEFLFSEQGKQHNPDGKQLSNNPLLDVAKNMTK